MSFSTVLVLLILSLTAQARAGILANHTIGESRDLGARGASVYQLFKFEDFEVCKLPNHDKDVKIPPPDCPPARQDRKGLLFRNAYSFDQKYFGFLGGPYYYKAPHNIVLVAPPPKLGNEPLTIMVDPDNPNINTFKLHSLNAMCREYADLPHDFISVGLEVTCTIKLVCDAFRPTRTQLTYTWTYTWVEHGTYLVDNPEHLWTLDDQWENLTKCVLTVDQDEHWDEDSAIMIDDLAVTVMEA